MSQKSTIASFGNVETQMDWDHLREFVSNDSDFEIEILSIFIENIPNYINELEASDVMAWAEVCHKIKGAARAIGAWAFAYQCELVEFAEPPEIGSQERNSIIKRLNEKLKPLRQAISSQHDVFKV